VTTAESIRKQGFRRWYERRLIEGHLYLVTAVLALVMLGAGFELYSGSQTAADLLFDGALVLGGGALAWFSWRGYATTMMAAEWVGSQAVCPNCRHHGFRAVPVAEWSGEFAATPRRELVALCRKCGSQWRIDPGT
jgi:hypothetical protein